MKATGNRWLVAVAIVAVLVLPRATQAQEPPSPPLTAGSASGVASGDPATPVPSVRLSDVLAVADTNGVSVLLAGSGPLHGTVFTLPNPDRVVVDLHGVVSHVERRVNPVEAAGIKRVRVSQNKVEPEPVVRVVVDLEHAMPYSFESTPKGAILRVGAPAPAVTGMAGAESATATAESAAEAGGEESRVPGSGEQAEGTAEASTPEPVPAMSSSPKPEAMAGEGTAQPAGSPPLPVESAAAEGAAETPTQAPVPARPPVTAQTPEKVPAAAAAQAEQGSSVQPPAEREEAQAQPAEQQPPAPSATGRPSVPPVHIVDVPVPKARDSSAAKAAPESQQAPAPQQQPAREAAPADSGPLTSPPTGEESGEKGAPTSADSPWTTTPAALVEQAQPATPVAGSTTTVESQEKRFTGEPISLELKDADIKDVLRTFAKITGLNIVVDPNVSGSVTVNLENVPWDQALDIILRINGLDYVVENNVLRVARIQTLMSEKKTLADYKKEEERAKPMRTVTKTLSYAKASDVAGILQQKRFLLSDAGDVVVDDRTNTLIIRDVADRVDNLLSLIDTLDTPVPQVMIEARIVETTRTFSQALGVTWGFSSVGDVEHGTTTGWKFPNTYSTSGGVNLGVPGYGSVDSQGNVLALTFGDALDAFNLSFALSAAEGNGLAKIVSSPKVQAQNNEKAHIQSGYMIPVQTVANNTVTVQYIDATLSLDVTPQITAEGTVILDIDLKKREPVLLNPPQGTNSPISTRDAKARLLVRDGGTAVIGGIYKFQDTTQRNSIPGLSKIPVLGLLFRNRTQNAQHEELLIFITPRIVKF
jgi:type IV pilus assembly protein PilQ